MGSGQFKYWRKTYIFSVGVLTLQAHVRHDPPQMASVAEDQPMYKPSPISYLRHQVTFEFTVKGSVAWCRWVNLMCADLLSPRIKLVEELLRDVGCIPRHGYHGADACNTCQLSVKWPHQRLRSYSIIHEKTKICFFLMLNLSLCPPEDFTLSAHLIAWTGVELVDLVHTDWRATRDLPI